MVSAWKVENIINCIHLDGKIDQIFFFILQYYKIWWRSYSTPTFDTDERQKLQSIHEVSFLPILSSIFNMQYDTVNTDFTIYAG